VTSGGIAPTEPLKACPDNPYRKALGKDMPCNAADKIMTVDVRPFAGLGHANHGWLDATHHFSFANYHDPARMGWGAIRVWNDDVIAPKSGFPPHGHRDMEIITYVRTGAISHQDNLGNQGRTIAGDVQVMSAGTGIQHAECNLENEPTTIFQIWILPSRAGEPPSWGTRSFPKGDRAGSWQVLASGQAADADALAIRTDARVLGATVAAGHSLSYDVGEGRHAYLVPATGTVTVNGATVKARDGAALSPGKVTIAALEEAEIILVDAP
jgi:quercetin 2,3-dioxygenase